jgi:hypothetical protein
MNQDQWTAVDGYFNDLLISIDPVMESVLADGGLRIIRPTF